jgi:mannose/cellobiose epimerase-like protein (N-acyl-D-glucosamine 2-epimerase family)
MINPLILKVVFILLRAGIEEARQWIREIYNTMEEHFWLKDKGLYASEATSNGKLKNYRGQNDDRHTCEAMIVAYEVNTEKIYLERATMIAEIMIASSKELDYQIWEHYHFDWTLDFQYNKDVRTNRYRP